MGKMVSLLDSFSRLGIEPELNLVSLDRIYMIFWIIYWFHHFPDKNDERQSATLKADKFASQNYFLHTY